MLQNASPKESKVPSSLAPDQTCQHFSLDEIRLATQNFREELVIGRGGFGNVYKGHISDHGSATVVAIKRLHPTSDQGAPEFEAEIEMLSKMRHFNLVSLIGYCKEGIEMILVYDYMPQGTLEDRLHKAVVPLSWLQRLKICIGAACGLDYLHTGTGTQHGVIHRDVKSSNVLLDENLAAKISDFGLAKEYERRLGRYRLYFPRPYLGPGNESWSHVSTGVKGTFGYMDPCYYYTGQLTRKSDVYSFGVILLEVLCGRRAVDSSLEEEQWGLAAWAQKSIKEGKLKLIIDSKLMGQISSNCLKQFAHIACRCLLDQPNQRPTMAEIVSRLKLVLSLQENLYSSVLDGKFLNKFMSFFPAKVQLQASKWMSASNEGEASDKAANKLAKTIVTTEIAEFVSSSNVSEQLIHFDASSFTREDLLQRSAELISKSSYWITYGVCIESGERILVRRIKTKLLLEEDSVLRKIQVLGRLCHTNILPPKAYYHGKYGAFYITDYIPSGSISLCLHSTNIEGEYRHIPLDWMTRMSIVVGITRGLVYLHNQENIVHGYLTSKNVLLDENYSPLIADVGLLLLLTEYARPKSPFNHAPELLKFQDANMETDVYSLGLIMLELLTGKSSDPEEKGINLPAWVMSIPSEELRDKVFDPDLIRKKSNTKRELVCMLNLAMACVSYSPAARPKADQVLQQLEEIMSMAKKERERMV